MTISGRKGKEKLVEILRETRVKLVTRCLRMCKFILFLCVFGKFHQRTRISLEDAVNRIIVFLFLTNSFAIYYIDNYNRCLKRKLIEVCWRIDIYFLFAFLRLRIYGTYLSNVTRFNLDYSCRAEQKAFGSERTVSFFKCQVSVLERDPRESVNLWIHGFIDLTIHASVRGNLWTYKLSAKLNSDRQIYVSIDLADL